ncbi:MAG: two-component sensor histidine kinase, partial [Saprospiraceae bacterium]|nr:two-component sensor histidine kinase [Saprospiraceae bacterium]
MKTSLPVEFYYLNNKWKTYLGIGGALIILLTMIYVNYLTQRLKEGESYTALVFSGAMENINRKQDLNQDFTFENDIIASIKSIPVILTDENMVPKIGRNYGVGKNEDIDYLSRRVQKLIEAGKKPLPINSAGVVEYLYYENSRLYTMLTYFPLFQGILLFGFIALGYIGFSNARRAEQNQVWVGMAKETAHQLGTPISAIMGWLQYLAEEENIDPGLRQEYLQEMSKDVDRLKLIADRFSKIGSTPELVKINLFEELDKCKEYMQKRSPKKVHFA